MAGQYLPGPQGVCPQHRRAFIDGGTLARATTPHPGVSGDELSVAEVQMLTMASALGDIHRAPLSVNEKEVLEKVIAFCRDMEDNALIKAIADALADTCLRFGEVPGGDSACWDPASNSVTINRSFIQRVLQSDRLPGTIDLAATLAHELEHMRQGRLTWARGASADANRAVGDSWASWGVLALSFYWYATPVPYCVYGAKKVANWTIGSINQGERSAWRVGLQKRLTWARHEYKRLQQLQARNAVQAEPMRIVAKRLKAIGDDFIVTYNDSRGEVRMQIGVLELTATNGKNISAGVAQQEILGYLAKAQQALNGLQP